MDLIKHKNARQNFEGGGKEKKGEEAENVQPYQRGKMTFRTSKH